MAILNRLYCSVLEKGFSTEKAERKLTEMSENEMFDFLFLNGTDVPQDRQKHLYIYEM